MNFFNDYINLLLLVISAFSGLFLLWPILNKQKISIEVTEAIQLINRNSALIVDLRDTQTYQSGHLPGAYHLSFDQISEKVANFERNKNRPILLISEDDRYATQTRKIFNEAGYTNVFFLRGGIFACKQIGIPIIRSLAEEK